jgi:hypothetical protein
MRNALFADDGKKKPLLLFIPGYCLDMPLPRYVVRQILNGISTLGWKPTWDSLLSNGTANFPSGSYQTGIVYGDYYYIKVRLLIGVHTLLPALVVYAGAPIRLCRTDHTHAMLGWE